MSPYRCLATGCIALMLILGLSLPASALSDADLAFLRKNETFRNVEKLLQQTLDEAPARLLPQDLAKLQELQQVWLKERDAEAAAMIEDGMDLTEVWVVLYDSQVEFLSGKIELYALNKTSDPFEGAYEYQPSQDRKGVTGVLSVRASTTEPAAYEISIEVLSGEASTPDLCSYIGAGSLQGKTLLVQAEEGDAPITLVFEGNTVSVTASLEANAQCGDSLSLDGRFTK